MIKATNILLFGGTTEGKATANWLNDMGFKFYYSTKTPSSFVVPQGSTSIVGALSTEEMIKLCVNNSIEVIIDAAHPYATELHHTIAECAQQCGMPTVRVERQLTDVEDDEHVVRVASLEEMQRFVKEGSYQRVLSLLGVKSIAYLHEHLVDLNTWYRILDRELSWNEALRCGVSKIQLIASSAFENLDDAKELIASKGIEVLLTKDSGYNGLFDQKVELAKFFNIPLVVLERPALPNYTAIVKHRAELKKVMSSHFTLPNKQLAHGYTTGTCATICSKAAASYLLSGIKPSSETIYLPDGEAVTMQIHTSACDDQSAFATVIKNSGDDPDLTDGMVIGSKVSLRKGDDIQFVQGEGVGIVRLAGLGLPIGEPAINAVPRDMIRSVLNELIEEYELDNGFDVSVFIPQGKRLAKNTFNPRLGVEGGLSIIGSTGRIKPFSSEAYIATIHRQLGLVLKNNIKHVVMNSGGRSEGYLKQYFGALPNYAFVQYGNYIGEALKIAANTGISKVSMGIMTGKAVKLADGHLDTHSREVVMNKEFLVQLAIDCQYSSLQIEKVRSIRMARELESIFPFSIDEPFFYQLKKRCHNTCQTLMQSTELELLLISNKGHII
ncbi:cobalt-precorrin-5B (C(1))-methyltransferase CbiD [uncultured Carboxylicivirga sp.]|nr:cobalt-precorrin-5B (C(1))-methyltransferase CbiD [uncultured Carboxylicivirga sp.]